MPESLVCLRETQVREPPGEILLIPFGTVEFTREGERGTFELDPEAARRILDEFNERGRDLVIDYEHQTLSGSQAPAAGWIDRLLLNDRGLVAKVKYWNADAEKYLRSGEYRYFSPVIRFDESGHPCALHSVALTNHPALHHPSALVASDTTTKPVETGENRKGHTMPDDRKEPLALTDEQVVTVAREVLGLSDATSENVRGKLLALKTQAELVPGLQSRVAELEAAADAEARRIALADLLATGRLNNAQAKSRYYSEMSLSDLKSYREATPAFSVVPLAEITKKEPQERKAETEKPSPILKNLGLSDEDIKAMKEQEARNGCAQ